MNIHERLQKAIESAKPKIDGDEKAQSGGIASDLGSAIFSTTVIPRTKNSEFLKANVGWVYSAVNVIADEAASLELYLKKYSKGTLADVEAHPSLDVLYRANNASTRFDLIQLTFQYLELTGEAPWFISFKNGKPDQIFLLRPDRLTVKAGKNGELIGGYTYRVQTDKGFEDIELEPWEVVPLRYADPDNPVRGKGPLQAAARTVDLDTFSEKWNAQFFANSASPSSAFQTDKTLAKEVRSKLEKTLKEKYQGINNSHKTLILEGGLKYQQISLSQKDMDYVQQQHFSRDKILAIFRTPPTVLGLTADVTRANAEATDYVFAKRTIKPKMRRFVEQLNEFYLPLFGVSSADLFFDFEDPVPENVDQNILIAQSGLQNGFLTVNEARELMGYEAVPDGDVLRDPASMNPIFSLSNTPIKTYKKEKKVPVYYRQARNARGSKKKQTDTQGKIIAKAVQKAVIPVIFQSLKQKYKKDIETKKAEKTNKSVFASGSFEEVKKAKYELQEKQLNVADDYEARMVKRLNSVFEKQKEIILRGLDSGEKKKLDPEKEADRYIAATETTLMEMMRKQAGLAYQFLGIQKRWTKADRTFLGTLRDYFTNRTFVFGSQVTRETNAKLADVFREATERGDSIDQIKRSVRDLFENMENYRSERIARSETIRASNFATEEAYKDSGVVEAKEWLTTKDERTDDECLAMDGKTIQLGDSFFDKGDSFLGMKLDYEDIDYPPLHVNCRCTLVPVIGSPIKQGEWRPSMNKEQVADFIKNSKYKGTLYHGTAENYGQNISTNGFNLSHGGGTGYNFVDGIYLTSDRGAAEVYANTTANGTNFGPQVLDVKINVQNIRTYSSIDGLFIEMARKFGPSVTPAQITAELLSQGVEAIRVQDDIVGQTWVAVLDPRRAVVLRQ